MADLKLQKYRRSIIIVAAYILAILGAANVFAGLYFIVFMAAGKKTGSVAMPICLLGGLYLCYVAYGVIMNKSSKFLQQFFFLISVMLYGGLVAIFRPLIMRFPGNHTQLYTALSLVAIFSLAVIFYRILNKIMLGCAGENEEAEEG